MAINSRVERSCCICLLIPFGRVFPNPDLTIDGADRQDIARTWRSISSGAVTSILKFVYYYYRRLRI